MYYTRHPFLKVGLPFLSAMLIGTALLVDIRKSRYTTKRNARAIEGEGKRSLKTLEEELTVNWACHYNNNGMIFIFVCL